MKIDEKDKERVTERVQSTVKIVYKIFKGKQNAKVTKRSRERREICYETNLDCFKYYREIVMEKCNQVRERKPFII